MPTLRTLGLALATACGGAHPNSNAAPPAAAACPGAIHDAVAKAYPGANQLGCVREREDGHDQYEVKLAKPDGGAAEVELALDGTITQVEEVIATTAVPEPVMKAFAAKYPGATPARAEHITRPGKPDLYELAQGREEVTFTATGELVEVEAADPADAKDAS